jgi:hypothetical protein
MRRLVGLYIIIACALNSIGQILIPMGKGLPSAPDKFTEYRNGIAAVYDDRNGNIEIQVWNGDFWYSLQKPNLPKTGVSADGDLQIVDLIQHNDALYLSVSYTTKYTSNAKNLILKWDNNQWDDISSSLVQESISLNNFFIEDNHLKAIGKFKIGSEQHNIIKLDDNVWSTEGNLLTKNINSDKFNSVVVAQGKVYATGRFTNPASGSVSLASWNGLEWNITDLPPFLSENIAVGNYHNNVVAYGRSQFETPPIKILVSGTWKDLSIGLENYEVNSINQFAEVQGNLFAVGQFTNTVTSNTHNLMMYNGESWNTTNLNLSSIQQLYSHQDGIVLSGDFSDNSNLNNLGFVETNKAQIIARVFNDKNGNCLKESNEEWIENYPIHLKNENRYTPTDENGQLYLQVNKDKHTLNAGSREYFTPTCPDLTLEIDEFKTYYGAALGVSQTLGITDVSVYITDIEGVTANIGEDKKANICIQNLGSQPLTGATLTLDLGNSFDDLNTSLPFENYEDGIATWSINLNQGETKCFEVSYKVKDQYNLKITADISPTSGIADSDASNNTSSLEYSIGTNTPNKKHCLNGKIIAPNTEILRYKIGIRNTTGKVITGLTVVDVLDIDIPLLHTRAYTSHSEYHPKTVVKTSINANNEWINKLTTTWENIRIEPGSDSSDMGTAFVDYNLIVSSEYMTKGLVICNDAKIYFEFDGGYYDEPKITNQVCSDVAEVLSTPNNIEKLRSLTNLTLGPNPVDGTLYIENSGTEMYSLLLTNSLGQDLAQIRVGAHSKAALDVKNLDAGIYIVYANGIFAQKIVLR